MTAVLRSARKSCRVSSKALATSWSPMSRSSPIRPGYERNIRAWRLLGHGLFLRSAQQAPPIPRKFMTTRRVERSSARNSSTPRAGAAGPGKSITTGPANSRGRFSPGIVGQPYSSYEYDYIGGVYSTAWYSTTRRSPAARPIRPTKSTSITPMRMPAKKFFFNDVVGQGLHQRGGGFRRERPRCNSLVSISGVTGSALFFAPEDYQRWDLSGLQGRLQSRHGPVLQRRGGRRLRFGAIGEGGLFRSEVEFALFLGRAGL